MTREGLPEEEAIFEASDAVSHVDARERTFQRLRTASAKVLRCKKQEKRLLEQRVVGDDVRELRARSRVGPCQPSLGLGLSQRTEQPLGV